MFNLGQHQTLNVVRQTDHGYYLQNTSDSTDDEVLLPTGLVDRDLQKGENIRVFLYKDGEERLTATTQDPKVTLNTIAFLRVKDVNNVGAFLDWGLSKDLFVPHREQLEDMRENQSYLVYMYLDGKTDRLAATTKLDHYLDNTEIEVEEGEEVDLWIREETDLGYNVTINEQHSGLIYHDEFFKDIHYGDQETGYIKQIRDDNKIDVTLRPIGYEKVAPNAQHILDRLEQSDGYLDLHDKSDPEEIHDRLEMSKKTFKKSIGRLYKKEIIRIEDDGIYLVS